MLSMLLCLCMALSLLTTAALAAGRFTDVKSGDYFAASVEWAVAEGITNGTTFSLNASLSTVSGGELRLSAFTFWVIVSCRETLENRTGVFLSKQNGTIPCPKEIYTQK